jgi:hypothetical protein
MRRSFLRWSAKLGILAPSSIDQAAIAEMQDDGFFRAGRAMPLPEGQTVPDPPEGYDVMFKDYFTCGLRFPSVGFLCQVLETFHLQLHHLTRNGFLTLSKFCWACRSYGSEPDIDTFYAYYELQKHPNKVKVEGVYHLAQYGSYAFMANVLRFHGTRRTSGTEVG